MKRSFFPLFSAILISSSAYTAEIPHDTDPQLSLPQCLAKKIQEIDNNTTFVKSASHPQRQNVRSAWDQFGKRSMRQMQAATTYPKKTLTIAGVDIEAHDISNKNYQFHIHTTAITLEKAKILEQYILSQRNLGNKRLSINQLNLDVCPLLSTSVIDPNTGGYTENCCNAGNELQVHLILKVDPKAINHMGPTDIYSPARGSIKKYLNNREGRETMVQYFTKNLYTMTSPQQLIIDTHISPNSRSGFNEVVVCGNSYTCFFKDAQDIEILGIGLSSYWLDKRKNPKMEDIEALKELGKLIPIVYYEPEFHGKTHDIFAGYLAKDQWLNRLKDLFNNKQYPTDMVKRRNAIIFALPFNILGMDPVIHKDFAHDYAEFINKYNKMITYIYDEHLTHDMDFLSRSLQDVLIANLKLGIKIMEIERKECIDAGEDPTDYDWEIAKYHKHLKFLTGIQEPLA